MKYVPTLRSGANAAERLSPSAPCEGGEGIDVPGPLRSKADLRVELQCRNAADRSRRSYLAGALQPFEPEILPV
jgi:hypothetical protein